MDSMGEHLHPNWRALATIPINLKRFVREGAEPQPKPEVKKQQQILPNVDGCEIKEFYEDLVKEDASKKQQKRQNINKVVPKLEKTVLKQPFDKNQFFRCCMSNDIAQLAKMDLTDTGDINCTDSFGWTALMMASCEGAVEAVKFLITLGVDTQKSNPKGQTAFDLAQMKGFSHVLEVLRREDYRRLDEANEHRDSQIESFYCDLCERQFSEATRLQHDTSTLHQFNEKSQLPPNKLHKFNIAPQNRGLKLMVKQGWDKESGLGPHEDGRLYPVKTCIRKNRSGLGTEQAPARVTHFQAFDERAVQRNTGSQYFGPSQRRRRNDMKREKVREWKRERRLRNELS